MHALAVRWGIVTASALAFVVAGIGSRASADPPARVRVVTLLADDTLVVSRLRGSGRLTLHLGRYRRGKVPPPRAIATGDLLGRAVAFVLVNGQVNSRVVAVDVESGAVAARFPLPAARRYAALVRVRQSLYAFGNDAKRRAIVVRVAVSGGAARTVFTGRKAFVYDGAVDTRSRFAIVSYHGARASGADVAPLEPGAPSCLRGPTVYEGCLAVHGAVDVRGGLVIATLGSDGVRVVRLDGTIVRTPPVQLAGNHFMAMAISADGIATVPGSCGYGGGIATVDIATGTEHVVTRPPQRPSDGTFGSAVGCGDGVALGPGSLVAYTRPSVPVPQPDGHGRVVVWQGRRVVARLPVYPDPVAVAFVEPASR